MLQRLNWLIYWLNIYGVRKKLLQALLSNTDPTNSFFKRRKTNPKQTLIMAKDKLLISVTISKELWKKREGKNIHTEKLSYFYHKM